MTTITGTVVGHRKTNDSGRFFAAVVEVATSDDTALIGTTLPALAARGTDVSVLLVGDTVTVAGSPSKHERYGFQLKDCTVLDHQHSVMPGLASALTVLPGIGKTLSAKLAAVGIDGLTADMIAATSPRTRTLRAAADAILPHLRERALLCAAGRSAERADRTVTRAAVDKPEFLEDLVTCPWSLVHVERSLFEWEEDDDQLDVATRTLRTITRLSWAEADTVARIAGLDMTNPVRGQIGIDHFLDKRHHKDGSTLLTQRQVRESCSELFDTTSEIFTAVRDHPRTTGVLVDVGSRREGHYGLSRYVLADQDLVTLVGERATPLAPLNHPHLAGLGDDQLAAAQMALIHTASIIVGAAGTGKTTTVGAAAKVARSNGCQVVCVAPSGLAVRRLSEATGVVGSTIHSLIVRSHFGKGPTHGEDDLLIVDEVSMVGAELFAALRECWHGRILLSGDPHQLTSIDPGAVLRDLIDGGRVPVIRLTEIRRHGDGAEIARIGGAIIGGDLPPESASGWTWSHLDTAAAAEDTTVRRVLELREVYGTDVVALAPVKDHPGGVNVLNSRLQDSINPIGRGGEVVLLDRRYRPGDPVVWTRTTKDRLHGSRGTVVNVTDNAADIRWDGEPKPSREYGKNMLLAYALTVHRAQGSEFAAVVTCLTPSGIYNSGRELAYTAVTRGIHHSEVIDVGGMLARAISLPHLERRVTAQSLGVGQ